MTTATHNNKKKPAEYCRQVLLTIWLVYVVDKKNYFKFLLPPIYRLLYCKILQVLY